MTQEELYEAIDATIAPNGQRGITAESLAALLKEIAANAGGGGSGQGALKIYTLDSGVDPEMANQIAAMHPDMVEPFMAYVNHNASVYSQIKTAWENNQESTFISVDLSSLMNLMMPAMGMEGMEYIAVIPASLAASKNDDGVLQVAIILDANEARSLAGSPAYKIENGGYILGEDGSVTEIE
jgi:hypothetical protein